MSCCGKVSRSRCTERASRASERVSKPNLVAAAVRLAGGPGAAATICGVSRQTIYDWINERRVERLIDALRLSRASGGRSKTWPGMTLKSWPPLLKHPPEAPGEEGFTDSPGL